MSMNGISTSRTIPVCTSMQHMQTATCEDVHLQELRTNIIQGWPQKKEEVTQSIRQSWPIKNELAMIDGIAMKGKRINYSVSITKNRYCSSCTVTVYEYGEATSAQISILIKHKHRYREYCKAVCNMPSLLEHTVIRKKTIPHELLSKPWEIVGADIFLI